VNGRTEYRDGGPGTVVRGTAPWPGSRNNCVFLGGGHGHGKLISILQGAPLASPKRASSLVEMFRSCPQCSNQAPCQVEWGVGTVAAPVAAARPLPAGISRSVGRL